MTPQEIAAVASVSTTPLEIILPGEPHAQKRPKFRRMRSRAGKDFVSTYDPAESRSWKGDAQVHYQRALELAELKPPGFTGPVEVTIIAVFGLPVSKHRKTPVPRRLSVGTKDCDNIAKAVLDAGKSILFTDDRQVARLVVEKWTGAQGEAAHVRVNVRAMDATPPASAPQQLALGGRG